MMKKNNSCGCCTGIQFGSVRFYPDIKDNSTGYVYDNHGNYLGTGKFTTGQLVIIPKEKLITF